MPKTLVLQILGSTTRHDIAQAIKKTSAKKVFLIVSRENKFCTQADFFKQTKQTADEKSMTITYVSQHNFTTNLIKKLGYDALSKLPPEQNEASVLIDDFLADLDDTTDSATEAVKAPAIEPFARHPIRATKHYWLNRSRFFFLICFLAIMYGIIFWWFQPQAIITIKPRVSSASILQNIVIEIAEAQIPETDAELPRVKGILVRTTIDDTETITAGGREYDITNAYGQITLFNETSEPKFLVPSRLEASNGLIFRFANNVTIPARDAEGPGKAVVKITADPYDEKGKPIGDRGNIIAGTELRFPALRDELQELYYGKANKGPLVGGSTLTRYIVEEEDIERAQGMVLENFRVRGIRALEEEVAGRSAREGGNQILLQNPALLIAESKKVLFPNELIGQESQTIEVQASVEVTGIVIDQQAIKKLMLENLKKIIDERQMIIALDEESLEYEILNADNFTEENWLKLSVKAIGIEQLDTDKNNKGVQKWEQNILQPLLGLSKEEVQSRLLNDPEIENIVSINIRPFWQKNIPNRIEQVHLKVIKVE